MDKLKNISNKSNEYLNKLNYSVKISKYFKNLVLMFKSFIVGYIKLFKIIIIHLNIFRIFIFWCQLKKNKKIIFDNLLTEQFNHSILEFIYIPFLLIIFIIQPWNYDLFQKFFEAKYCCNKLKTFRKILIRFFKDFRYIFIFFLLMITIIDTIPTILLLIRIIKIKFFPNEKNKLTYALNYKTEEFRTELVHIYNKNIKKL